MTRTRLLATGAILVAASAVAAPTGSAQAPGPTTLSLYEPANGGSFKIVDNAPRSPVSNPESRKYRFSVGDEFIFSNPVLDKKGGSKVATLYVKATVVSGKTFASVNTLSNVVLAFNDGSQLHAAGVFSFSKDVRIAITGGTGIYIGARGQVVSHSNADDSSQDTITLLP
jgi:Dirigent-like protein